MAEILYFIAFFLVFDNVVFSQIDYNKNWIIGGDVSGFDPNGDAILFDFNHSPVKIEHINSLPDLELEGTNTIMSNKNGELLFFSNGCYIVNAAHEIMFNGFNLADGLLDDLWCSTGQSGNPMYQGAISIPSPEGDSFFYMFNLDYEEVEMPVAGWVNIAPLHIYAQKIDMSKDNGLGAVVEKNRIVLEDTLSRSGLQAVQHENGRDWWIVMPEFNSNCFYIRLVRT